jgi:hypothetical protein
MVLAAFANGRARLRLLRDGLLATGRLIEKTRTNVRVNDRRVYRMFPEQSPPMRWDSLWRADRWRISCCLR